MKVSCMRPYVPPISPLIGPVMTPLIVAPTVVFPAVFKHYALATWMLVFPEVLPIVPTPGKGMAPVIV